MRAQANALEYIPLMALLLMLAEAQGLPAWALIILAIGTMLGRISHAYGVVWAEPKFKNFTWRIVGMSLTWTPLGFAAAIVLCQAMGVL